MDDLLVCLAADSFNARLTGYETFPLNTVTHTVAEIDYQPWREDRSDYKSAVNPKKAQTSTNTVLPTNIQIAYRNHVALPNWTIR